MPLGRGLMYTGRLNIYRTTTTITSISPTLANCGDTVTFNVTVTNNTGGGPTPTGTVSIVNTVSGNVLATGTLTAGSAAISTTPSVSLGKYVAIYSGVHNAFETSTSAISNYNIGLTTTTTTVLTANNLYFCYAQPVFISAHVAAASGPFPSGSVRFILYGDDINFVELPSATLNGSGNATSTIPSFTTTDGYDYWLQAVYDGYGCWNSSESPGGMLGKTLHSISHDVTSTVVGISGSDTFCAHDDITLISGTTSTLLVNPSVGSVHFVATNNDAPITIDLGISSIINGSSSIFVPGDTFSVGSTWSITANYISDGYCYANSTSSNLLVLTSTLWDTATDITGPSSYCYTVGANFTVTVSSIVTGTISGHLKVSLLNVAGAGVVVYDNDISGPNSGINTIVTIPGSLVGGGVALRHLSAIFTADVAGCYADSTSSDFNVSVLDC